MTAEQIVRALAAAEKPYVYNSSDMPICGLCGHDVSRHDEDGGYHLDDHPPDCPWRLAVEWRDAART